MSIKKDTQNASENSLEEAPNEKWFNTKLNGAECTEVRFYLESLPSENYVLQLSDQDIEFLTLRVIGHLAKKKSIKWAHITIERRLKNQARVTFYRFLCGACRRG